MVNRQIGAACKPFMDEAEVEALSAALDLFKNPIRALEWGSGNSTIFFSSLLPEGSTWSSYEHNPEWYQEVQSRLKEHQVHWAEVTLVQPNRPFQGPSDGDYLTFRNYVVAPAKKGGSYDFVLVDGRARVECMAVGWGLLGQHGIMTLHDAQRREYDDGIPRDCFWLRMTNPRVVNEGSISVVFAAKSPETMAALAQRLEEILPPHIELQSNVPPGSRPGSRMQPAAPPSILFLNICYNGFLTHIYHERYPGLAAQPYAVQKQHLIGDLFGDSDFYSHNLASHGWRGEDLIVNAAPAQEAWARENGVAADDFGLVLEQVRRFAPDVVYIHDMYAYPHPFLEALRGLGVQLIAGQIASPMAEGTPFHAYDLVFSSFPHFVDRFNRAGIKAVLQPLAFEPRVLSHLPKFRYDERPVQCSFVGGISQMHQKGNQLLETLVSRTPLQIWGYGAESLPADSPIRPRHHGEAWGKGMYSILASSRITVNRHIDVAENNANNLRMYEATGCGALLLTDYKDNLHELFEIGKEVVAYRCAEECADLINYYLDHPEDASAIAAAGHRRTLRDHAYRIRMERTGALLREHIKDKRR